MDHQQNELQKELKINGNRSYFSNIKTRFPSLMEKHLIEIFSAKCECSINYLSLKMLENILLYSNLKIGYWKF